MDNDPWRNPFADDDNLPKASTSKPTPSVVASVPEWVPAAVEPRAAALASNPSWDPDPSADGEEGVWTWNQSSQSQKPKPSQSSGSGWAEHSWSDTHHETEAEASTTPYASPTIAIQDEPYSYQSPPLPTRSGLSAVESHPWVTPTPEQIDDGDEQSPPRPDTPPPPELRPHSISPPRSPNDGFGSFEVGASFEASDSGGLIPGSNSWGEPTQATFGATTIGEEPAWGAGVTKFRREDDDVPATTGGDDSWAQAAVAQQRQDRLVVSTCNLMDSSDYPITFQTPC